MTNQKVSKLLTTCVQKFAKAEEQRKTFMVQLYGATEANRILNTEHRLKQERIHKTKSQSKYVSIFLNHNATLMIFI